MFVVQWAFDCQVWGQEEVIGNLESCKSVFTLLNMQSDKLSYLYLKSTDGVILRKKMSSVMEKHDPKCEEID